MLRLTDDQMTHVFRAADPLHPTDRSAFLADVAAALNGHEIGDGLVGRVGRGALRLADAAGLPLGVAVARMRALAVSARRAVIPKRDDCPSGTTWMRPSARSLGIRGADMRRRRHCGGSATNDLKRIAPRVGDC